MEFSFKKDERLCGNENVRRVYQDGRGFNSYPFHIHWRVSDQKNTFPAKVAISVPKRKFKNAVDRNWLKRRIKEAYRINKIPFYNFLNNKDLSIEFLLIFISSEKLDYKTIEPKMKSMLVKFEREILRHLS